MLLSEVDALSKDLPTRLQPKLIHTDTYTYARPASLFLLGVGGRLAFADLLTSRFPP